MRASDADRERVAVRLRDEAGEGRLDPEELEQRVESAYAAKTLRDLDGLVADLPREEPPRERSWHWHPLIVLVAVLVAVSAIVGHAVFWLAFPLFFFVWRPLRWRRAYY